ncbi:hypothetical protein VB780_12165 [Leptolyngbya sp. CCNP1308]|uniref:NACHT domain-containing protein n=1 Tax=Leptolyngbya sp. CCNP1308 TaxID=3110255 RepID=UPI002B20A8B1|nr:hypothetical protein [Leptolyngbya sp. CCNP1308]MEA5449328.1 hypothetical protein [Leptolyngbya sp. CCNP1308]
MLAEIGYKGFSSDQLFFTQPELVSQIKSFLADTVDKPKYLDGRAILNAIAIQQGILVERSENIFSFSHLTLQEYLTAQYLSQDPELIKELVRSYSVDQRWREVFLLVSGSLQNSDKLMQFMEAEGKGSLKTPKVKAILTWITQNTNKSGCRFKVSVERAIILSIFLTFATFKSKNFTKVFNIAVSANDLATALDSQSFRISHLLRVLAGSLVSLRDSIDDLDSLVARYKEATIEARSDSKPYYDSSFDEQILYYNDDVPTHLSHFEGVSGINIVDHPEQGFSVDAEDIARASVLVCQHFDDLTKMLQELNLFDNNIRQKILEIQIPNMRFPFNPKSSGEVKLILRIAQTFLERGSRIWWQTLDLPEEWTSLSEEEIELIKNYLYITELMVRCREEAVRVSEKVWIGIEEQILIPSVD